MDPKQKVIDLKSELARIQAKLSASSDRDIAEALQFKVDTLSDQILAAQKDVEEADEAAALTVEPSEKISDSELEREIRLARAHIAGQRKPAAREILAKLERAAPNNVDVLELKADMLITSKDLTNALPLLKRAFKADPKNITVEKKLAEVAMRSSTMGSIDDQMRSGLGSNMIVEGDMKASATAATVYSVFIPGAGHLFVGMTTKGIVYLTIWIATIVPLSIIVGNQLLKIKGNIHEFNPSMWVIALFFIAAMDYFVALFECAALGKAPGSGKRKTIEHPKPPVDLPFE